jgi:RNA polymerase sigma-B factor
VHDQPGRISSGLATLDNQELLRIMQSVPRGSEQRSAACGLLVSRHRYLVRACAQRYWRSPEPAEDLMQVGYVGLLRAINDFDPAFGTSLAAYARPCISGELKRHFRDKRWLVQVPRSLKQLTVEVRDATRQLTQELGRIPTESDLTSHLGICGADLREARRAEMAFRPLSLDTPLAGQPDASTLADSLGEEDPQLEHLLGMQAIAAHWGELSTRDQAILLLRFHGEMTQAQIGQKLGLSQMHVSRLLARALAYLRLRVAALQEDLPAGHAPPRARQLGESHQRASDIARQDGERGFPPEMPPSAQQVAHRHAG